MTTTEAKPIYGKQIFEAVWKNPAICKKLELFSRPLTLAPMSEITLRNLESLAETLGMHDTADQRIIVRASETIHEISALGSLWMQRRIRRSNENPFKDSLSSSITKFVLKTLVATASFPTTDIRIESRHSSDQYNRAYETLRGVREAIANIWDAREFDESLWADAISAVAKSREFEGDEVSPRVSKEQALRTVLAEFSADPFMRVRLSIRYAIGIAKEPAFSLFGYAAAESCIAVFSAWATFLLASQRGGYGTYCGLLEAILDDFAAGNFFVGVDDFTLLAS